MRKMMIGVTAWREEPEEGTPYFLTKEKDVEAVIGAGALPVLLPAGIPLEDIPALACSFDGFVFTGGGDLDPSLFGEENHEKIDGVNPQRDAFELALMREVLELDLPLLAICRGMQTLNVACGGNLFLDIASQLPQAGKHDWWGNFERDKLVHRVKIEPRSKLAEILMVNEAQTNSLHHQAVKEPGEGLRAVAWAEDGVIEAIEHTEKRFAIGVQWHPEWLQAQEPMRALYRAFVKACQEDHARRCG